MPGTPLPPLVAQHVQHRAGAISAYNMLRRLETTILAENEMTKGKGKRDVDLMYCRIVGHFFHCVPSDFGFVNLVKEVSSTGGDRQKLLDLGKLYYDHAFRVCEFTQYSVHSLCFDKISVRSAKGRTPLQSRHSSRPSFDTLADMIKKMPHRVMRQQRKRRVRAFRVMISCH